MEFRGQLWLQHTQIWIQSGLFGAWLLALGLSVAVFWRPRSPRFHRIARGVWMVAMLGFLALWVGGATIEMMRRAAPSSGRGLVLALAAFSLLMAGVVSLARECFDAERRLLPGRVVLTLLALTLAGGFFGGFALPWNTLFGTGGVAAEVLLPNAMPAGWILALGGAQLLTVAHALKPDAETTAALKSPREATIWLGGCFALVVGWNFVEHRLLSLVVYAGFASFLIRAWSVRLAWKRRGETTIWIAASLVLALLAFGFRESFGFWKIHIASSWPVWPHVLALGIVVLLCGVIWRTRVNASLQLAIEGSAATRALLWGTFVGALAATLLFGPTGALWWSFWPLAGLFFDLLQVDDDTEHNWRRLHALKHDIRAHKRSNSARLERALDEPVELSVAGRPTEDR